MKKLFIVFDLDDTLADTTHRQPLLDAEYPDEATRWNTFFDACDADTPKTELLTVLDTLVSAGHKVDIWTGRSMRVFEKTRAWLHKHLKYFDYCILRMREEGDHREDWIIKGEWIDQFGKPDLVFDDRNKAVAWWREQGITCCQVKISDF